jgi:hypothetical protein
MTDPRLVRMDAEDVKRIIRILADAGHAPTAGRLRTAYSEGITEEEAAPVLKVDLRQYGIAKVERGWPPHRCDRFTDKLRAAFTQEDS